MNTKSKRWNFRKSLLVTFFIGVVFFVGLSFLQMNDSVTEADIFYSNLILEKYDINTQSIHRDFQTQVDFTKAVQKAVQHYAQTKDCIPLNHPRDIKDLYDYACGLCYDKSHVIEKILRIHGFETRHVSMYYYKKWYERIWVGFIPRSGSHAVSEVKTKKGWMLLDSLSPVLGLDEKNEPVDLGKFRKMLNNGKVAPSIAKLPTYRQKFIFVYGVYSRNGRLYPPYNFIPDYKFSELKYNFMP